MELNWLEQAWAAGFIDGEGHFRARILPKNAYVQGHVNQVDRRPLDRLVQAIGGKVYGPYRHGDWQPMYYWASHKHSFGMIIPFLCEPKLEQLDRARIRASDARALRKLS